MAKLDLTVAIYHFAITTNRPPQPTEMEKLRLLSHTISIVTGAKDFAKEWERVLVAMHNPVIAAEDVKWKSLITIRP